MAKYFFLGAFQTLLLSIPVPLFFLATLSIFPLGVSFALSLAFAALLIWKFALPYFKV